MDLASANPPIRKCMKQSAVTVRETLNPRRPALSLVIGGKVDGAKRPLRFPPSDIVALGIILSLLQVADGFLTGLGMANYGTAMEGNALLRALMGLVGWLPALILVKGASISLIALLCHQASTIRWLRPAFYGVIAIYMTMAVLPWSYILLSDLFA